MAVYRFHKGRTRLLVSIPHAGTYVPPELAERMTAEGRALPDTDWHVDRLYDFLTLMGATVLVATHSRYVVDLNRAPDGEPLYPGLEESSVCPATTFGGKAIWRARHEPDAAEVGQRVADFWQPYHDRLKQEIEALREQHGSVVLWDAHSIRSRVPRLFGGQLPVFNFGTNDSRSCHTDLAGRLFGHALATCGAAVVLDGRFKGGYITRTYGKPAAGIDAVQLELAQRSYMDESSHTYLPRRAREIRPVLRALLEIAIAA